VLFRSVLGDAEGGLDVRRRLSGAKGLAPRVLLRAKVGIGALEVVHRPEDALFLEHGHGLHHAAAGASDNGACRGGAVA
jgi:hypothetical protein